jgi:hypothetical protein
MKTEGPGMSDVLVASGVADANVPYKRWRDANPAPSVGAIGRGQKLWLVWENYDFDVESGQTAFDIKISVKRVRSAAGSIAASVVGALAGIAKVSPGPDQVDVQYARTAAHSSITVETIALDLQTTPAGNYAVTVQVADKVGGRTFSRTVMITIQN